MGLGNFQVVVLALLMVSAFIFEVVCLVDAVRRPAAAFTSAGKATKQTWLWILVGAVVIGFLALPYPLGLGFFLFGGLMALAAAIVYWVDVRPAVGPYRRPRR